MSEANETAAERIAAVTGLVIQFCGVSDSTTTEADKRWLIRNINQLVKDKLADAQSTITTLRNLLDALAPSSSSGAEAVTAAELLERLATENEGLKAEVERLKGEVVACEYIASGNKTELDEVTRERGELRAALKPFADAATDFNPGRSDDEVIARISHAGTEKYVITLGDLRKAADVCGVGSGSTEQARRPA